MDDTRELIDPKQGITTTFSTEGVGGRTMMSVKQDGKTVHLTKRDISFLSDLARVWIID